jgi:hypothetical protein
MSEKNNKAEAFDKLTKIGFHTPSLACGKWAYKKNSRL